MKSSGVAPDPVGLVSSKKGEIWTQTDMHMGRCHVRMATETGVQL